MMAKITLGTRGSELARAQTLLVEKAIQSAHPSIAIETKIIVTHGDNATVVDLNAGRKGLFTAEIERALLAREVDVAVHSAKDLPSQTNPAAQIAAVLPRALFVSAGGHGIIALQIRSNDQNTKAFLASVNDPDTLLCLQAEREFLSLLHGDCNFPVGVYATISNGRMKLRTQVFEGELPMPRQAEVDGASDEGDQLAAELLRKIEQD